MIAKRLLMTVDSVGGVWQYATELATALAAYNYDTVLALIGPSASAAQREHVAQLANVELIETGLPLDWLSPDASTVGATAAALAALARSLDIDVVQLNQPAFAATGAFAVPVVAVVHSCVGTWWQAIDDGPEPAAFGWQSDLVAAGLHRADRVVCPSRAFAASITARYAVAATAVHNGRTAVELPVGTPIAAAFTAGRLWDRGKNIATLDDAASRLRVPFLAAGSLTGPSGEAARVTWLRTLGHIDEAQLHDHLARRPVFVSAARYEPFGLAVLEAALAGCALVLSDIPTFRELWDGAAHFVEPNNAAGFAAAVDELIDNPDLRLVSGEAARGHAVRYSATAMASGMAAVFDDVLDPTVDRVAA